MSQCYSISTIIDAKVQGGQQEVLDIPKLGLADSGPSLIAPTGKSQPERSLAPTYDASSYCQSLPVTFWVNNSQFIND